MSLTSMLADKTSPLRTLLEAELPDLPALRAAYTAARPAHWQVTLPQPPDDRVPAWSILGAAIDHRLRFALSDVPIHPNSALSDGVLISGTPRIGRPGPVARALKTVGTELLDELRRFAVKHGTADRTLPMRLPDAAEDWLNRACYIATLYEMIYRTGRLWPGTPLGDARAGITLERLIDEVPAYAVADLTAMIDRAESALAGVREATAPSDVASGPTFRGSPDVGGADADWIAGGLMIDVKATKTPHKLDLSAIYQLAGYALLDYQDEKQITQVGWYLARTGWLVTWDISEFFALLGTRRPLPELRGLTAATLRSAQ